MPCSRELSRIDRSPGVQEPQRERWFSTQRTEPGSAIPPSHSSLSCRARRSSSSSEGRVRRSERSSRSSIVCTHSATCRRVRLAGTMTTTRSPSR